MFLIVVSAILILSSKTALGAILPPVPGHEVVGDVVAIGEGVGQFSLGDRVKRPWHAGKSHFPL